MNKYYVKKIAVKGLWGYRNFNITFFDDINIIIGPNASGKTTLINILHHALTANVLALSQLKFESIDIALKAFDGDAESRVQISQGNDSLELLFDDERALLPVSAWRDSIDPSEYSSRSMKRRLISESSDIRHRLIEQVPAVWLPVSRRLPISDEEEADRRRLHRFPLESVDECLEELLKSLKSYRVSLDSHLSELRKDFQRHALETVLYDKQHDRVTYSGSFLNMPSEEDRAQLEAAFVDLGIFDRRIKNRIDDHFAAAVTAREKLETDPSRLDVDSLLIVPLMNRTKSMVRFAQELEQKRTALFRSLRLYEDIASSFLVDKDVAVDDRGNLTVHSEAKPKRIFEWRHLSSGEKQIIILLTQALLSERDPVVYVADEPELSLHVSWQEKLISSLRSLAGRCQFIVATHSPDIAGGFHDKIINMGHQ